MRFKLPPGTGLCAQDVNDVTDAMKKEIARLELVEVDLLQRVAAANVAAKILDQQEQGRGAHDGCARAQAQLNAARAKEGVMADTIRYERDELRKIQDELTAARRTARTAMQCLREILGKGLICSWTQHPDGSVAVDYFPFTAEDRARLQEETERANSNAERADEALRALQLGARDAQERGAHVRTTARDDRSARERERKPAENDRQAPGGEQRTAGAGAAQRLDRRQAGRADDEQRHPADARRRPAAAHDVRGDGRCHPRVARGGPMIREHFWGPYPPALARAEKLAAGCKRTPGAIILELGPGAIPFSQATHFVDREGSAPSPAVDALIAAEDLADDPPRFSGLDLSHEALPFHDGEVDFLYARHVLEDLADPLNLLHEIARVAKAGYIETPSPVAELCRGVDGGSPPWRGYHHHRTICWVEDEADSTAAVLHLVAKYPIIEHLRLDDEALELWLNKGPLQWNTYVFFDQGLDWKLHEHDVDMKVWDGTYEKLLNRAVKASLERNERVDERLARRRALREERQSFERAHPVDWEKMLARDPATPHVESISSAPPEKGFEKVLEAFIPDFVPAPTIRPPAPIGRFVVDRYDNQRWPGALAQRWWAHDDGGVALRKVEEIEPEFHLFPSILVGGSWVGGRDLEDIVATYGLRGVLSLDDHERRGHLPEGQGLDVLAMPTPDDCTARPAAFWWKGVKFARGVLAKGRLMVACGMGQSRSAAMTYAILRCVLGMSPELARGRILRGIPEAGPHPSWSSIQGYIQSIETMIEGLRNAMEDLA